MVEAIKIGNKTLVMDGKILSLFRRGSLLRQMYYGGYEDFDGANGGVWKKYINIPIKTVPLEYAQYLIEIDDTNVSVYNAKGDLKAQASIASVFWSLVRSDGFDIRAFDHLFNQLWFWVEMFDYTNKKAKIWVRLPENSEELNIAFGNEKASESSYNNGDETFEFFDDFEGSELDTAKWTTENIYGTGGNYLDYSVSNGLLTVKSTADENRQAIVSKDIVFNKNNIAEIKIVEVSGANTISCIVYQTGDLYENVPTDTPANEYAIWRIVSASGTKLYSGSIIYPEYIAYFKYVSDSTIVFGTNKTGDVYSEQSYFGDVGYKLAMYSYKQGYYTVDWVRVLKLADPADFGTPRIIEF